MKNAEIAPLVERVKEGDPKAFEELYSNIWDIVYYIALRHVNNHADAMDVTQEVLIVVNKEIHKLNNNFAFNSWLHRITYNKCSKFIMSKNRKGVVFFDDVEEQLTENRIEFLPNEALENNEIRKLILETINELPHEQRQTLLLYYFVAMPTKEIANLLGLSDNAVHHKLSRARVKIKQKISQFGKDDEKLLSAAPATLILSQILLEDSATVCTSEVKNSILFSLNKMLAPTSKMISAAAISKVVVAISLSLAGGAYFVVQSNHEKAQTNTSTEIQSEKPKVTSAPIVAKKTYQTLEDFVGVEDAQFILTGKQIQSGDFNNQLMEIVNRHLITFSHYFVDESDKDFTSYLVYYLDKEDKRLILIESYKAVGNAWQVMYQISDKFSLPANTEIVKLFQE